MKYQLRKRNKNEQIHFYQFLFIDILFSNDQTFKPLNIKAI